MAPTKQSKYRRPISITRKVQAGRVGRTDSPRGYANRNKGKELILSNPSAQKELFPTTTNAAKELLPHLLPVIDRSSSNTHTRNRTLAPIANFTRRPKSRAMAAVQAANLKQRREKQIQDGTTKRLQAMTFDPGYAVEDARFMSTVPYRSARLDLLASAPIRQHQKLEFAIAVGFWGFAPTFTPVKIFSLSIERFADPKGLASLILANTDVKKATAQIGIDIEKVTFIGFEVQYPKGYRYIDHTENDILGRPREYNTSFEIVRSRERVLINTTCAMREFFWQTQHYATDESGRVLIQVVGRIGKTNSNGYENFDANWRNDAEKDLAAEQKRRYLESQSFADSTERKTIDEKMRAIEERSRVAVTNAQARKQQMKELVADQEHDSGNATRNVERVAQDIEASNVEDDFDDLELDLDVDLV